MTASFRVSDRVVVWDAAANAWRLGTVLHVKPPPCCGQEATVPYTVHLDVPLVVPGPFGPRNVWEVEVDARNIRMAR